MFLLVFIKYLSSSHSLSSLSVTSKRKSFFLFSLFKTLILFIWCRSYNVKPKSDKDIFSIVCQNEFFEIIMCLVEYVLGRDVKPPKNEERNSIVSSIHQFAEFLIEKFINFDANIIIREKYCRSKSKSVADCRYYVSSNFIAITHHINDIRGRR